MKKLIVIVIFILSQTEIFSQARINILLGQGNGQVVGYTLDTSSNVGVSTLYKNSLKLNIADTSIIHNQITQLSASIASNTSSILGRVDSIRNNAGVLEIRKNSVFVPQFTLPTVASIASKQDTLNWFMPEHYGAVGDGSTDDAPAFNAMMAAMPTNSTISLSAKTYVLNSTWFITRPVKVIGCGIGSIFKCGVNNIDMIKISADYVVMRDFFMYNLNTPTAGCAIKIDSSVAHPTPISKFTMDNITINQYFNSIEAINALGWTMTNCQINYVNYGVKVNCAVIDAGDSHISGCTFQPRSGFTGVAAIYQIGSGGLRIVNNKFNGNGVNDYSYAYYANNFVNTVDLIITGNSFENYNYSAIKLSSSFVLATAWRFHNISITGNQFGSYRPGSKPDIQIDSAYNISIQSNVFLWSSGTNDTCIKITQSTDVNINNTYTGYAVPVYYAGTNANLFGDGAGAKYSIPSYSSLKVIGTPSSTLSDSANIFGITTPTYGNVYPANYMNSATGNVKISFSSNLASGGVSRSCNHKFKYSRQWICLFSTDRFSGRNSFNENIR